MKRLTPTCAQRTDQMAIRTDDVVAFHAIRTDFRMDFRTEIRAQICTEIRADFRCFLYSPHRFLYAIFCHPDPTVATSHLASFRINYACMNVIPPQKPLGKTHCMGVISHYRTRRVPPTLHLIGIKWAVMRVNLYIE